MTNTIMMLFGVHFELQQFRRFLFRLNKRQQDQPFSHFCRLKQVVASSVPQLCHALLLFVLANTIPNKPHRRFTLHDTTRRHHSNRIKNIIAAKATAATTYETFHSHSYNVITVSSSLLLCISSQSYSSLDISYVRTFLFSHFEVVCLCPLVFGRAEVSVVGLVGGMLCWFALGSWPIHVCGLNVGLTEILALTNLV